MRKRYINIIAVCMAAIVVAACGKEQIQQIVPDPEPGNEPEVEVGALDKLTVEAEVATKTTLNGSNVYWSDGDAISVFSTDHRVNHRFESSLSQDKRKAKFSGEIESGTTEMVAVYPYTSDAVYSDGKITGISIPTEQTATESSFANGASVTIAKATKEADAKTVQLAFQNLCAVLQFTVPEGMGESSKIMVKSINTAVNMSGAATIDIAKSTITASEPYVELTGNFVPGHTYCVTVAPRNYNQGFKFILTDKSGNSFERTLKVDDGVNAEKVGIYVIGALNPEPADDAAWISSCSIDHTYDEENSTLTGSTATVTFETNVTLGEFASNIKGWKVKNVTMKKDGTVLYRSLPDGTAFTNGQQIILNAVSGMPYMPQGSYTFSADIYYTVKKADGSDADKFLKTVTTTNVTSPEPDASKFTLTASPTGYTSYSVYKGTDGQTASAANANNVKNDVIKGIGGHCPGLSPAVHDQGINDKFLSFTATYDGQTTPDANGNSAEWLSWGAHTVKCTSVTFDGVTQSCNSEKTVYISGLPYELTHKADDKSKTHGHTWKLFDNGHIEFHSDNIEIYTLAGQPIVQSYKGFYVNSGSISTKVSWRIQRTDGNKARGVGIRQSGAEELSTTLEKNAWWESSSTKWSISNGAWFEVVSLYGYSGPHIHIYEFKVEYNNNSQN